MGIGKISKTDSHSLHCRDAGKRTYTVASVYLEVSLAISIKKCMCIYIYTATLLLIFYTIKYLHTCTRICGRQGDRREQSKDDGSGTERRSPGRKAEGAKERTAVGWNLVPKVTFPPWT